MSTSDKTIFWVKIVFIIVCFCEAFFAGIFTTLNKNCRENPKVLGIANSFAGGVFLAIAFIHILPEEVEDWNEYEETDSSFPLPYLLVFAGYTLILIIDKVLFDTQALFGDEETDAPVDSADKKFEASIKTSMAQLSAAEATGDKVNIRKTMV